MRPRRPPAAASLAAEESWRLLFFSCLAVFAVQLPYGGRAVYLVFFNGFAYTAFLSAQPGRHGEIRVAAP